MLLHRLTLSCFCQIKFRQIEFSPRLNMIVGPNGSGKSTVLAAVTFAITGSCPTNGKLTANITDTAGPDEASFVEAEFSHGDVYAVVRRNLRPARPVATLTLSRNGNVYSTVEGANDVNAAIYALLQANEQILNTTVFIQQEAMYDFLSMTKSTRAAAFQRLFRTENAAVIHDFLGKKSGAIVEPQLALTVDDLNRRLIGSRSEIQLQQEAIGPANKELQSIPPHSELDKVIRRYEQLSASNQARIAAEQHLLGKKQELVSTQDNLTQWQGSLSECVTQVGLIQQALDSNNADFEAARDALRNIADTRRRTEQISQLSAASQAVEKQIAAIGPIEEIPNAVERIREAWEAITAARAELNSAKGLVQLVSGGATECPTCHTPAADLGPAANQAREKIPGLEVRIAQLQQEATLLEQKNAHSNQARQQKELLETKLAGLREQISSVRADNGKTAPAVGEEEARQKVEQLDVLRAGLHDLTETKNTAQRWVDHYGAQVSLLSNEITKLDARLVDMPACSPDALNQALVAAQSASPQRLRRSELERMITGAETRIAELYKDVIWVEAQIVKAQDAVAQAAIARQWKDTITAVRDVFHRNNSPRLVAQRNLAAMEARINEALSAGGSSFVVETTDDLSFMARFADGRQQPGDRLSPGQKVSLAAAFRVAMGSMCAHYLGLLFLDEPTAFLDNERVSSFVDVLSLLRSRSENSALQVCIITHAQSLAPHFDHVIQM